MSTSTAKTTNLHVAKQAKNDEFYTQLVDIEAELQHYKHHFKDKVVYCNCDDPKASRFHHFFVKKFRSYGLKKLITACYKNQHQDLFSSHDCEKAVYLEYNGCKTGRPRHLSSDGDFRHPEMIELLKQADIVCTNPPFSLFREYIAQLVEYDKRFLVIGNMGAVTYKEIFPLVRNNKIWLGQSISSGDREFGVPDHYPLNAAGQRVDENGNKFIRVKGIRWFTNLDYEKRHENLDCYESYSPDKYLKYDNYDAINVNKTADIPYDYTGVMGVPVSFMDKYNPEQFEILGLSAKQGFGLESHKFYDEFVEVRQNGSLTGSSGKKTNGNPMMKGRPQKTNYYQKGDEIVHSLYSRIFIRHKHSAGA